MSSEGSSPATEMRPYIGGQAVIEGVMMRSPHYFAMVLRRRSGSLTLQEKRMPDVRTGFWSWPLLRGIVTLVEALRLGSRALRFSVEQYEADLEEEERGGKGAGTGASLAMLARSTFSLVTKGLVGVITSDLEPRPSSGSDRSDRSIPWLAIVLALILFVALPQAAAAGVGKLLGGDVDIRSPGFQLLTGAFKLLIVIGYILLIRRIKEVRRVFMYHGAEHKAIAAYEAGDGLAVAFARGKSRLHPRCGTTFLVMVVFVSILVFSAMGPLLPVLPLGDVAENLLFFLMKLPFLPVIAAITYEIQRFTARYCLRGPLRLVLYPGFAVQGITTIEPDDAQLEVALASLHSALRMEQSGEDVPRSAHVKHFDDFYHLMAQPPGVLPWNKPS